MLATLDSCSLYGIDAFHVIVEVISAGGALPSYDVVGLPNAAVREGAVRIRAALGQTGVNLPPSRTTVNLAPADRRKVGAALDLPIALGIVLANELAEPDAVQGLLVYGELGLDGTLRPVRGALSAALLARERGLRGVLVPEASASEAAVLTDMEVYAAAHLAEVIAAMRGDATLRRITAGQARQRPSMRSEDMSDVRGHASARTALEIAVAGGHNVLMSGPPGIGKTMLARRLPSILPPLAEDESLETTKIHSACGLAPGGLIVERPFRAPHASVSAAALLGGGSPPRAGEISLAHNGVLFLDELPEFPRAVTEALRQPLEDRLVTISRVSGTVTLPASFLLVASANPCPCGYAGSRLRTCICSPRAVERYRARLSGPLLDRIDLQIFVHAVSLADLRDRAPGEPSHAIRERVVRARQRQRERLLPHGCRTNAEMTPRVTRATCHLDTAAEEALERLSEARRMTARTVDRLLKVARTIADLRETDVITAPLVRQAAAYRALDSDPGVDVRRFA